MWTSPWGLTGGGGRGRHGVYLIKDPCRWSKEPFRVTSPSILASPECVADGTPSQEGGNQNSGDSLPVLFILGGACLTAWSGTLPAICQSHPENPVPAGRAGGPHPRAQLRHSDSVQVAGILPLVVQPEGSPYHTLYQSPNATIMLPKNHPQSQRAFTTVIYSKSRVQSQSIQDEQIHFRFC